MTGKVQDMAPCLNKRVERDNCFLLMFFSWCAVQFPFLYLRYWVHVDIIFMLFTLQSCVKLIHIKNETWIFCTFQSDNPNFINYSPIPCFFFYVSSHMNLQTRCATSNDFSVLMVLIQCLFWFIHIDFFFTRFTKSVGFVLFSSPMQHSHIYTVFKHYNEQDAMIEKQKFVQCHHWLVKSGEKKQDEMETKWVLRLLTMEKAW